MTIGRDDITVGMEVQGTDNVTIGTVRSVGESSFGIDRPLEPPTTLPFTAISHIADGVVRVMVTARELGNSSPPTTDLYAPFRNVQVTPGMPVVGSDRVSIGTVQLVEGDRFLLRRPKKQDVYIPFDLINDIINNEVIVDVPAGQIDWMNFPVA